MRSTSLIRQPGGLAVPAATPRSRSSASILVTRGALPLLIAAVIVFAWVTTPAFMTADNGSAILMNASVVGILAVSMTPITLSGNFVSLAAQQQTVLAAVIFLGLLASGHPAWLAIILVLLVSILVGTLQGIIVAAGLNPVVTSLATGSVLVGVMTLGTEGRLVTAPGADISWIVGRGLLGVPAPVYLFVSLTLILMFVVDRTTGGRRIMLVGSNKATASISGISHQSIAVWVFIAFSIGAAFAGFVLAAQLGQITPYDSANLSIDVIAAVLVGGVSIRGGEGSPLNSAVGAVLIAVFNNVMVLQGLAEGWRMTIVGTAVILMVCLLHILRRRI